MKTFKEVKFSTGTKLVERYQLVTKKTWGEITTEYYEVKKMVEGTIELYIEKGHEIISLKKEISELPFVTIEDIENV